MILCFKKRSKINVAISTRVIWATEFIPTKLMHLECCHTEKSFDRYGYNANDRGDNESQTTK